MQVQNWQEGFNKIVDHIVQLLDDGDTLLKKGSYAHAYFLYFTTLEEIATANYIMARIENPDPSGLKEILFYHSKKIPLAVRDLFPPEIEDFPHLTNILKDYEDKEEILTGSKEDLRSKDFKLAKRIEKREDLWYWRNRVIYTTLNETCTDFYTPFDITLEIVKKLRDRIDIRIAELRAYKDVYFNFKDQLPIVKKIKKDLKNKSLLEEKKIINQSINYSEFFNVVLKGSLEEITKFKNISPEIKDLYTSILTNKELDESIFEKVINEFQKLWQNMVKIDEPKSEIEKTISKYYKERLLYYKPDYFEKEKSDMQKVMEDGAKIFADKLVDKSIINISEREEVMAMLPQILQIIFGFTEENKKLINIYEEKLKINPKDAESLKNLADLLLNLNFYDEAYNCYLSLHYLDKKNMDVLYVLAEIEYKINHNFKKATKNYKKVLKQNADVKEIHFNLGDIYETMGKYKKAIQSYSNVIRLDFDSDESWFRLGRINYNRKKIYDAYYFLKISLKINPLHEEANNLLKNLLSQF